MEQELGMKLVASKGRSIQLTDAGARLAIGPFGGHCNCLRRSL
ncbi:hypothetical protein [Paenibacillus haidiansis]